MQNVLADLAVESEAAMARDEKLELLRRIPLFSGFDKRRLQRLGMLPKMRAMPPGSGRHP